MSKPAVPSWRSGSWGWWGGLLVLLLLPDAALAQPAAKTPAPLVEEPELLPPSTDRAAPAAPVTPAPSPPMAPPPVPPAPLPVAPPTAPAPVPAVSAAPLAPTPRVVTPPPAAESDTITETPLDVDDEEANAADPLSQTLLGPVGLLRTSAALVGPPGAWRLALRGEYASSNGLIVKFDRNRRLGGNLALSITPWRYLEAYAAILASSNHNQRCASGTRECTDETNRVDPPYIRAFGDVVLGAKLAAEVAPSVNLGVELGSRLYAGSDGLGFDGDSTSLWLLALSTFDLRKSASFPVLVHANLGYLSDQSEHLSDYERLGPTMANSRAVAGFAYGVAKPRMRLALGLEAPIGPPEGPLFQPFVEYQFDYVTADPDAAFADYLPPRCGATTASKPCSEGRGQHRLGFGLRASTAGGFGFDLGVEIGAGSVGYPYGPPLPPWNFVFGFGYKGSATRAAPQRVVMIERVVERPVQPNVGFVGGRIFDARTNTALPGAIVDVVGGARLRVATDSDGAFVTKGLAPGPVDLEVSAPGFGSQVVRAQVARAETTALDVSLLPMPPPEPVAPLPPSPAAPASTGAAKLPSPDKATVVLDHGKLTFRRPLRFVGTPEAPSAELTAESLQVLDELAALLNQPGIDKVRIEAHWDSGLDKAKAQTLTQEQADTVARQLGARGVAAGRLEAVGAGSSKPRVPNLGPQSRARNRRVEITLPGFSGGTTKL
jgi:hypothetical protein